MFHAPTTENQRQNDTSRTALRPGQTPELSLPAPTAMLSRWSGAAPHHKVTRLHSTYGNQAVLRLLSHSTPTIQTKLTLNKPGDAFEQEADRVADQVMRMADPPSVQRKCSSCEEEEKLNRKCAECEEEDKKGELHRREINAGPQFAPPSVHAVLNSSGQPLDPATRAFMEPRFGHDFSAVRIHTDASAANSAGAVNALAYTSGQHVVFGSNQYSPRTHEGQRLLAHELAHVVQSKPHLARQPANPPPAPAPNPAPNPPTSPSASPPQSTCTPPTDAAAQIASQGIPAKVIASMRYAIGKGTIRASQAIPLTDALINQADAAIKAQFGSLLPSRSFSKGGSITKQTPDQIANARVPDEDAARRIIRQVALRTSGDALSALCITTEDDSVLDSAVAVPVLASVGIKTVRDYEKSEIGGVTSFPTQAGALPNVTLPTESPNIGHIVVHEAMHFYVHDVYRQTAEAGQSRREMMEGGAEFMARLVIMNQIPSDPNFQINYSTYSSEVDFVYKNYTSFGGNFPLAYLQGRVDVIGLTPPAPPAVPAAPAPPAPVHPKMKISQSSDPLEQEADRVADQVMHMTAPSAIQRKCSSCQEEENLGPALSAQPEIVQRQPNPAAQAPKCSPASQPVRQLPADFSTPDNVQALAEIMWHEMGTKVPESTAVGSIVVNRLLSTKFHRVAQLKSFERKADPPQSQLDLACNLLSGQVADTTNGSWYYFSPQSMPDEANPGCCTGQSGPCSNANLKGSDCAGGLQVVPGTDPPRKVFFPQFAKGKSPQPQPTGTDPMLIQAYQQ